MYNGKKELERKIRRLRMEVEMLDREYERKQFRRQHLIGRNAPDAWIARMDGDISDANAACNKAFAELAAAEAELEAWEEA